MGWGYGMRKAAARAVGYASKVVTSPVRAFAGVVTGAAALASVSSGSGVRISTSARWWPTALAEDKQQTELEKIIDQQQNDKNGGEQDEDEDDDENSLDRLAKDMEDKEKGMELGMCYHTITLLYCYTPHYITECMNERTASG